MQKHAMPEPFSECLKGSENLLTVKIDYTRLSNGYHGSIITKYSGNFITNVLMHLHPDSVIRIDEGVVRIDFVYIWPDDLEEHEALTVWRQSRIGLAYSETGIGGPYMYVAV